MGVATFARMHRRRVALKTSGAAPTVEAVTVPAEVVIAVEAAATIAITDEELERATAPSLRSTKPRASHR